MVSEKDLYPVISNWLSRLLKSRFGRSKIIVEDTSRIKLSRWLENKGINSRVRYGQFFDFKVDISAAIIGDKGVRLYLMECKTKPITIKDLSQILGYGRIVEPYRAVIISPSGVSKNLFRLIMVSGRTDVLRYNHTKKTDSLIRICKWDIERNDVDFLASIPLGYHP